MFLLHVLVRFKHVFMNVFLLQLTNPFVSCARVFCVCLLMLLCVDDRAINSTIEAVAVAAIQHMN